MLTWAAFGGAWIAGLTLFGCLFLITRRLGVSWQKTGMNYSLAPGDSVWIGKLLLGREAPPADANVSSLIWIVRGCWLAMLVLVLSFALLMTGVV